MTTGGQKEVGWNLVTDGNLNLESPDKTPYYISIVICQNKIVAIDNKDKIKIHRLHDGKFLDMLDSESPPRAIRLMDATTICILHYDGLIKMASIKSEDMSPVFTIIKSFRLHGELLDRYHCVVRVNDNIVAVGEKQDTTYWCIVSLGDGQLVDGHVNTIHHICKGSIWSDVTTKENTIYISCCTGVPFRDDTGVYGFDILNPSQSKYKYKHQRLQKPTSIVVNKYGNIFVGNNGLHDSCIHQLTASCQLVTIFTRRIPHHITAMFWYHIRLYVTCDRSRDITVLKCVYHGHKESNVLVSKERNQPGIEESAIQIRQGNVDHGQSSVETELPPSVPSPEDSEDEKHGNHTDSEFPISDEGKQPIIEGTSAQIGQEITAQIVEEHLNRAGIQMSKEELDLFIKFQKIIGTDIYFSKGLHRSRVGQETLEATDTFFAKSRPDMMDKWLEYKSQGKLTPELIDVIYAKERYPELHAIKYKILEHMEDLNIIVKGRTFDENGVKEENYFFTACLLRPKSQREGIAPEQDPLMLSTTLCWDFTGTYVQYFICDRLLSACIARWPVAKKKDTSEHLISHGYAVFDLDCIHRLTLTFKNHVVLAAITWLVVHNIKTPDAKSCTIVRMFISQTLAKITNSLNQNIHYELCLQRPDSRIRFAPFQMWFEDGIHDPDSPIKREHMNHARLCIALVTVCGKALREMLVDNFPVPCLDIYQAILANYAKLTGEQGKPLLDEEQIKLVFSDPLGQKTGTVDMFDLSLLYKLIRNVSRVQPPINGWGKDPNLWETSLGASAERIRKYRNDIGGHSPDAKIEDTKFNDYWKMFEDVLHDIETAINKKEVYSEELDRQKRQVISVFDAC